MRWHRIWYGDASLTYVPDSREWAAWSIDRISRSNGSRTHWHTYVAVYLGERTGPAHSRLSEAKSYVESHG